MTGTVEVTLLGFELDIVARRAVALPLPSVIRLPVLVPPGTSTWRYADFEYQGMGIYRRVR